MGYNRRCTRETNGSYWELSCRYDAPNLVPWVRLSLLFIRTGVSLSETWLRRLKSSNTVQCSNSWYVHIGTELRVSLRLAAHGHMRLSQSQLRHMVIGGRILQAIIQRTKSVRYLRMLTINIIPTTSDVAYLRKRWLTSLNLRARKLERPQEFPGNNRGYPRG